MRFAPYFLGLSLGLLSLACSGSSTTTTTIVRPELIAVSPDDFLGAVACEDGEAAGALHSYVATLFDVTLPTDAGTDDPGFQLPSSPPTPCTQPVTFSFVVSDHLYVAVVDGYDRPATVLAPLAPGSRLLFGASAERVAPLWAASCGGYPLSPRPDAGIDSSIDSSAAGAGNDQPTGVRARYALTQTAHDCGSGLVPVAN
jgi:hypothetical protein